jgi:uncharacterized protein (TIGR03067 family)
MVIHAILFLAAGLLPASDTTKEDAAKKELEKLQGTWKITSLEVGGKPLPEDAVSGTFTLKGDKYTFKTDDQEEEGTFKIDPSKKPPAIDLLIGSGMDKGKTQLGVYKLEGDRLTLCFAVAGDKERPGKFATAEDSNQLLFGLKKAN